MKAQSNFITSIKAKINMIRIIPYNILKNVRLLFPVLLLSACGQSPQQQTEATQQENENVVELTTGQLKNTPITLGKLEEHNISSVIKVNGKIDVPPHSLVSVSAPLGGYLKFSKLLPGVHVKKGEIIATLEDPQYVQLQEDYLVAKSKLHFAQLEYDRQKELNQSKASSDKVTQQALAELKHQTILVNSLSEKLKLININPQTLTPEKISKSISIHSTINGFVSKVNVNIGKYANPADVLFELIDPEDIHLNLNINQQHAGQLAIGQEMVAYNNTNPEKKYPAEIILISHDISPEGFVEVHCHFEQYDKSFLPGMYMNADLELNKQKMQTLPEEAIVSFEGKDYVFAAQKNNQYVMMPVQTGMKENGLISILNFQELMDKEIVVKGAYTLLMKLKNVED